MRFAKIIITGPVDLPPEGKSKRAWILDATMEAIPQHYTKSYVSEVSDGTTELEALKNGLALVADEIMKP